MGIIGEKVPLTAIVRTRSDIPESKKGTQLFEQLTAPQYFRIETSQRNLAKDNNNECLAPVTPVTVRWELALRSFAHDATREHGSLYGGDQCAAFESSPTEPAPIAIEDVVLGTRTLGGNTIREDYDASFAEPVSLPR